MNTLPFCGYWFIGATSDSERASYYVSYGLLSSITEMTIGVGGSMFMHPTTHMFM